MILKGNGKETPKSKLRDKNHSEKYLLICNSRGKMGVLGHFDSFWTTFIISPKFNRKNKKKIKKKLKINVQNHQSKLDSFLKIPKKQQQKTKAKSHEN